MLEGVREQSCFRQDRRQSQTVNHAAPTRLDSTGRRRPRDASEIQGDLANVDWRMAEKQTCWMSVSRTIRSFF